MGVKDTIVVFLFFFSDLSSGREFSYRSKIKISVVREIASHLEPERYVGRLSTRSYTLRLQHQVGSSLSFFRMAYCLYSYPRLLESESVVKPVDRGSTVVFF